MSERLAPEAVTKIGAALNALRADMFALYMKTKNFDWCLSGPHLRDYHLLLDEQANQLYAATDAIVERVTELGEATFSDYYLLLDERASQICATKDPIAEHVRRRSSPTLRSLAYLLRLQRRLDNSAAYVTLIDILTELRRDNLRLTVSLRRTRGFCEAYADVATASLIESWTDEAEARISSLFDARRTPESPNG